MLANNKPVPPVTYVPSLPGKRPTIKLMPGFGFSNNWCIKPHLEPRILNRLGFNVLSTDVNGLTELEIPSAWDLHSPNSFIVVLTCKGRDILMVEYYADTEPKLTFLWYMQDNYLFGFDMEYEVEFGSTDFAVQKQTVNRHLTILANHIKDTTTTH